MCKRYGGVVGFINCEDGLLQGETILLILFTLFANDNEIFLSNNNENMITLDHLLFADDIPFFEAPKRLQ